MTIFIWLSRLSFICETTNFHSGTARLLRRLRHEQIARTGLEHDIGAAPGLIVDQPPLVSAADAVLGHQYVARTQDERLAVAGGELERARQRDHVLRLGRLVPIERRVRRRLLEMDRHHVGAVVLGNGALLDVRSIVRTGLELERMQHERPQARLSGRRKPARPQPSEFPVVAQFRERAVDRVAQILIVLGERDAELLMGRHLRGDRQLRAILDQPRDHGKELDHQADASGLEIVERGGDAVIGIVPDAGDGAFGQQAPGDEVGGVARLDAGGQAAQIGGRRDVRREPPVDRDTLVEFEVGLRKQHAGGALRRDRRSRDHRVAAPLRQAVEDAVEVVARIRHRLQRQPERRANRAHQLDVEAARRPSSMRSNGGSG